MNLYKSLVFVFMFLVLLPMFSFGQSAKVRTEPIGVGAIAPDFSLPDQNGKTLRLSEINQTTVIVFYRGYWCPFCARQLAELRGLLKGDEKVSLLAISVDNAMKSKGLAAKIAKDGKGEVGFPILTDAGHKTIDAYGLFDTSYLGEDVEGIPHPAIFILDKSRKIVWAKVETDYKKRPTNQEIRAELDKLK